MAPEKLVGANEFRREVGERRVFRCRDEKLLPEDRLNPRYPLWTGYENPSDPLNERFCHVIQIGPVQKDLLATSSDWPESECAPWPWNELQPERSAGNELAEWVVPAERVDQIPRSNKHPMLHPPKSYGQPIGAKDPAYVPQVIVVYPPNKEETNEEGDRNRHAWNSQQEGDMDDR